MMAAYLPAISRRRCHGATATAITANLCLAWACKIDETQGSTLIQAGVEPLSAVCRKQ